MSCEECGLFKAVVLRPKNGAKLCKTCFFEAFEDEIHRTIEDSAMFRSGERVAVGVSGGKDSTVLAHVLDLLNRRHCYGLELFLLCIDEGIRGYRDHSLRMAQENQRELGLRMTVLSFEELFGVSMDTVVAKAGRRGSCTSCGTLRRRALEIGAQRLGAGCIATGHNADDTAETVLLNLFRGDVNRLRRCTAARTADSVIPRCKPFRLTFQKEIVMYAFHKRLRYFSTECEYSPGAFRGDMRLFVKDVEKIDPCLVTNLIKSGDDFAAQLSAPDSAHPCERCGVQTLTAVCQVCRLAESLSRM